MKKFLMIAALVSTSAFAQVDPMSDAFLARVRDLTIANGGDPAIAYKQYFEATKMRIEIELQKAKVRQAQAEAIIAEQRAQEAKAGR